MATRQEIKESFIQDIINTLTLYHTFDVDDYNRIVSTSDGQFTDSQNLEDENQDVVIYNETYQSHYNFNSVVDAVADCHKQSSLSIGESESNITYIDYSIASSYQAVGEDGSSPFIILSTSTATCPSQIEVTDGLLSVLSQLVGFDNENVAIDPLKAKEVLDTNIFELIPQTKTRQQEINDFFATYNRLKGDLPQWTLDFNQDGIPDHYLDTSAESAYNSNHNVSSNPTNGFIDRLNSDANEDNFNSGRTLEALRADIDTYLRDIDSEIEVTPEDERPTYVNKSPGHLKIRQLNQAIIVRSKEDENLAVETYQQDGFTITMWVKFLDKVSSGTLFNYGNPTRDVNPLGFKLETFTVNRDDYSSAVISSLPSEFFSQGETERFVRLVVREGGDDDFIRDSHVGRVGKARIATNDTPALEQDETYAFNYTHVPLNLNEWYFIVANYYPDVLEDTSLSNYGDTYAEDNNFWRWNKYPSDGSLTSLSAVYDIDGVTIIDGPFGAKCKVEIISKSDLLRARGFKPE